LTDFHSV